MRRSLWIFACLVSVFVLMGATSYHKPFGSTNDEGVLDKVTSATRVITSDHGAIHDGLAFTVALDSIAVAASGTISIGIKTPPAGTYIHLKRIESFTTSASATFIVREASGFTRGDSLQSPRNRNRVGTPPVSACSVWVNPTSGNDGTVLEKMFCGSGGVGSGTASNTRPNDLELVLKPATLYLIRMTNNDGSAKALQMSLFWYEETY